MGLGLLSRTDSMSLAFLALLLPGLTTIFDSPALLPHPQTLSTDSRMALDHPWPPPAACKDRAEDARFDAGDYMDDDDDSDEVSSSSRNSKGVGELVPPTENLLALCHAGLLRRAGAPAPCPLIYVFCTLLI
jgi:hypothetical protein